MRPTLGTSGPQRQVLYIQCFETRDEQFFRRSVFFCGATYRNNIYRWPQKKHKIKKEIISVDGHKKTQTDLRNKKNGIFPFF